jgi:hypothetical protein
MRGWSGWLASGVSLLLVAASCGGTDAGDLFEDDHGDGSVGSAGSGATGGVAATGGGSATGGVATGGAGTGGAAATGGSSAAGGSSASGGALQDGSAGSAAAEGDGSAPIDGPAEADGTEGIVCGNTVCTGNQTCCHADPGGQRCIEPNQNCTCAGAFCNSIELSCDGREDCAMGQVCCFVNGITSQIVECRATCVNGTTDDRDPLCRTTDPMPCEAADETCGPDPSLPPGVTTCNRI